jgi:hypothetical protein
MLVLTTAPTTPLIASEHYVESRPGFWRLMASIPHFALTQPIITSDTTTLVPSHMDQSGNVGNSRQTCGAKFVIDTTKDPYISTTLFPSPLSRPPSQYPPFFLKPKTVGQKPHSNLFKRERVQRECTTINYKNPKSKGYIQLWKRINPM